MEAQTRQTLENLRSILAAAGATLADVVKVQIFVTDMSQFAVLNRTYLEFFSGEPPSRVSAGVAALALGALVEMDCVAYRVR